MNLIEETVLYSEKKVAATYKGILKLVAILLHVRSNYRFD